MDRLEEMTTFVKIVEAGGISHAAAHLNIAKSAVSRRIADLEERLGARLISRTTRRMSLTDAGKIFYSRCLQILNDVEEAEVLASNTQVELKGPLRVAAPLSFGILHLQEVITEFQLAHPQVTLDLQLNDRRIDVIEEGFDLAIRIGELSDSTLIARRITTIQHAICASPAFWNAHGIPQTPLDLQAMPCLHYSNAPSGNRITLHDQSEKPITIRLNTHMLCNNGDFSRTAALAGVGFIISPTFIVYRDIESGALQQVLPEYVYSNMSLNAVYPSRRFVSKKVIALVQLLRKRFQKTPYWDEVISKHDSA